MHATQALFQVLVWFHITQAIYWQCMFSERCLLQWLILPLIKETHFNIIEEQLSSELITVLRCANARTLQF